MENGCLSESPRTQLEQQTLSIPYFFPPFPFLFGRPLTWLMCFSLSIIWLTTGSGPFIFSSWRLNWFFMPFLAAFWLYLERGRWRKGWSHEGPKHKKSWLYLTTVVKLTTSSLQPFRPRDGLWCKRKTAPHRVYLQWRTVNIQQILIQHPFFPPRSWGYNNEQDRQSLPSYCVLDPVWKSKGQWQLRVIESCVKEVLGLRGAHSRDLNSKCAFYSLEKDPCMVFTSSFSSTSSSHHFL